MKKLRDALNIFLKYQPDELIGGAGHDIIWLSTLGKEKISPDDLIKLEECGVHWSQEFDCWSMFA